MSAEGFRQEMPPKGGFGGIAWQRIPLKKPWSGLKLFTAWAILTGASFRVYIEGIRYRRRLQRENDDVYVALEPLLVAERDRMIKTQNLLKASHALLVYLSLLFANRLCCLKCDNFKNSY
ncbi:uncharacterized protein TNCT_217531 [Trichonephila clavata]|uniref:NADH dehydrogenase [ubiquinone] 1 alpha subcomplex subunit 13 n=1 Tax=Trichonephila clavata TaxID=2740835 RepID=A0A8X6L8H6_TRICU|nr:uncharacterized protein TNCT_217531 [Trichonephila clavata]